jgi:hypothetical protein
MAARQGACRRCDAVTTVTCAPAESMPRREGRAWHRERLRREACRRDAVQPRGARASERRGAGRGSRRSAGRPQEALVQEEKPTGVALHRCQARGCARPWARMRHAPGHNTGNQRTHARDARSRCVARRRTATSVRIETKRHDDHGHRQTFQG